MLSAVSPAGARNVIDEYLAGSELQDMTIDSSGNYIICESHADILSKVTPDGVRTVIYSGINRPGDVVVITTTAVELFIADVTDSGLGVTWTQSADPLFSAYQVYQSTTQEPIGDVDRDQYGRR